MFSHESITASLLAADHDECTVTGHLASLCKQMKCMMIKHNPYTVLKPDAYKSTTPKHTLKIKDITCSHTQNPYRHWTADQT